MSAKDKRQHVVVLVVVPSLDEPESTGVTCVTRYVDGIVCYLYARRLGGKNDEFYWVENGCGAAHVPTTPVALPNSQHWRFAIREEAQKMGVYLDLIVHL